MTAAPILGLVATWFVLGMARIVFTSKLAEHRIDDPDPAQALSANPEAAARRIDAANYDASGRRLLPWYRVVSTTYWIVAIGGVLWAVSHG